MNIKPGDKLVRFLHAFGGCHQLVTTEAKAKEYVRKWRNKECDFFYDEDGTWAVRASAVNVIEMVDAAQAFAAQEKAMAEQTKAQQLPLSFLPKRSAAISGLYSG